MSDLRERLESGVNLYNRGEYDEALSAFESALDIDPHNKYARLFTLKIHRVPRRPRARGLHPRSMPCRASRARWRSSRAISSIRRRVSCSRA